MTDRANEGNLRGVARPAPRLLAALRLLHGGATIPLEEALDSARAVDALAKLLDRAIGESLREDSTIDLPLLAAHIIRATKEERPMNQVRVNQLAKEHYAPKYAKHAEHSDVIAASKKIAAEEEAKGADDVQTLRGVRTRIHEMLQLRESPPDPKYDASGGVSSGELQAFLADHHDHQTAHFQALWAHADALAAKVLGAS